MTSLSRMFPGEEDSDFQFLWGDADGFSDGTGDETSINSPGILQDAGVNAQQPDSGMASDIPATPQLAQNDRPVHLVRGKLRRMNQIPKGSGRGARSDPSDGYNFREGTAFSVLPNYPTTPITAGLARAICKTARERYRSVPGVSKLTHLALRRLPNRYCWLDENWAIIQPVCILHAISEFNKRQR
jgi:hypothetical protein